MTAISLLKPMIAALTGILAVFRSQQTRVVASDGPQQVSWLWKNKRVCWEDTIEIKTGKKSCTVTITGSDGKKIVHS
ncbi:hypothetical protein EDE15_3177 [Edaphobacter aggregans]|uniref:Uncharacterized protein n=1 Tax=Edaphobacter aggregans TaxID=570835 RepID=A0A3R9NZS0_9BACT|nr:hypothetical protein EDE15_3177 [Edaphobacter aggregans]